MATTEQARRDARVEVGRSLIELEPTSIIELYELYFDVDQKPFRFHAGTNNIRKNIVWDGNEYYSTAIEVEGFEANIMGRLPRPKVTVANSDYIISNILRDFSDFRNGKFIRIKTFLKHLDDVNFDYEGVNRRTTPFQIPKNPYGTPNPLLYISKEKYLVSQKIIENKQLVQFELITPFDLQSLETATRAIYGRYCYWQYRGAGCNYQGDLICQENDKDFTIKPDRSRSQFLKTSPTSYADENYEKTLLRFSWEAGRSYKAGDIVFLLNIDFNGLKDPPRSWFVCQQDHDSTRSIMPGSSPEYWQKDGCSKTIEGCKKRFTKGFFIPSSSNLTSSAEIAVLASNLNYVSYNDASILNGILPFGGFPGTDKFKYE